MCATARQEVRSGPRAAGLTGRTRSAPCTRPRSVDRAAPRNLDRGPTLVTDLVEPGRPGPAPRAAALPRPGAGPELARPAQATISTAAPPARAAVPLSRAGQA